LWLVLTVALSAPAFPAPGQTAPAAAMRTLLATGHLASVTEAPLYFRLYRARLPAGQRASYGGSNAMLYGVSGALAIDIGGATQPLAEGTGAFVPAGQATTITASGSEPASFLVFLLSPAPNQRRPLLDRPAVVGELYRTPEALPGLKPGPYDFSFTRVAFPPGMPVNRTHYRSGAALYYVIAGAGAVTADAKTELRPAGAAQFEPAGWVHQWANPGNTPLVVLQANISQEGVAAVLPASAQATPK
jgi:quercetin dioxygenase-like cupin family protein